MDLATRFASKDAKEVRRKLRAPSPVQRPVPVGQWVAHGHDGSGPTRTGARCAYRGERWIRLKVREGGEPKRTHVKRQEAREEVPEGSL